MKKYIGWLLVGLSFLSFAIIIALGNISVTLKEVASGNFGVGSVYNEISVLSYISIFIAITIGIVLLVYQKNDE